MIFVTVYCQINRIHRLVWALCASFLVELKKKFEWNVIYKRMQWGSCARTVDSLCITVIHWKFLFHFLHEWKYGCNVYASRIAFCRIEGCPVNANLKYQLLRHCPSKTPNLCERTALNKQQGKYKISNIKKSALKSKKKIKEKKNDEKVSVVVQN